MNLSAAALRLMAEKGLTLSDVAEIVAANERRDPTNAERQARHRARRSATQNNGVTVTGVTPSPNDNILTPTPDSFDEADASSPTRQPIAEAISIWNENAADVGWPTIRTMSASRQKLLAARLRQHGLDGWRAAIAKAKASPYLSGADPPAWFTFPWLIKSENFLKLIEGNYDHRNRQDRPASGWQAAYHANMGAGGYS